MTNLNSERLNVRLDCEMNDNNNYNNNNNEGSDNNIGSCHSCQQHCRRQQLFHATTNHRRKQLRLLQQLPLAAYIVIVGLTGLCHASSSGSGSSSSSIVLEGSDTSYAQFRPWDGGANSTLEFEFKTSQANGLLMYTDNIHENEYLLLNLVDGNVRLRFNWGDGANILTVRPSTSFVDNKMWHKVIVARLGEETTLIVDQLPRVTHKPVLSAPRPVDIDTSVNTESVDDDESQLAAMLMSRVFGRRKDNLSARDAVTFGNASTNGYVFIGGLPSWYGEKQDGMMVLSTVMFEPRFRGAIRKLKYKDTKSDQSRTQDVIAYKGVRANTVEACALKDPCRNGGLCVSTDNGPWCDCSNVDYEGGFCEEDDPAPEVTLRGQEYITLNLQMRTIEPILSANDEISMFFKTRKSNGLLFYTGNGHDYMHISLRDGGVALTVQLGTGKLDTSIQPGNVRFDDNVWHHLLVVRVSKETNPGHTTCHVTLTVDGSYTESWMTSGSFSILASSTVFVGGSEGTVPGAKNNNNINLIGCIKKATFKADSLHLDFLKLAKKGNKLISVIGDVEWKCKDIGPGSPLAYKSGTGGDNHLASFLNEQKKQAGVISFTREEAFLALPVWKSSLSGSISFMFRTIEANGLLFFNGGGNPGKDYFALELLDGHLHLHLDLGSGAIKHKSSKNPLNDGHWHRVELTLKKNQGRITVDGDTDAFETPGDANQLDLVGSLYVGSVDYMDPYLLIPPAVWSATLRYGFVGCLKELFVNGAAINVVAYAHEQDVGSIRSSCHQMPDQCHNRPCMHSGNCTEGWNRHVCDCSQTGFSGPVCGNAAATIKLTGANSLMIPIPTGVTNEADDITIRFRTLEQNGLLLTTRHDRSQDKLELSLESARVRVTVQMGSAPEKTFYVGQSLNDDVFHTLVYKRRGTKIRAVIDDDAPMLAEIVPSSGGVVETVIRFSEIHVGGINPGTQAVSSIPGFKGSLQQLTFNGEDIFELARSGQLSHKYQMSAQFAETNIEETIHHAVSFTASHTYIGLPQMKAYNAINIRFQFRTFEPNGMLLYNAGKASDFIAVELVEGRIQYTLNLGYGPINIKNNAPESLADNKWHWVVIGRPSRYRHTLMVDGHFTTATTQGDNYHLDLDGILHLGGVRQNMYDNLPRPLLSKNGFQGCIASLETNGELIDPIKDALVPSTLVEEGCEESVSFEWGLKGGIISFRYPSDKRPDTSRDTLSVGFITPSFDAVLMRIDGHPGATSDYLQLEIIGGKIFLNYNLGSKDITIGDIATKVNDGRYHVVRFSRSDINSTLQVDDNPVQSKYPQGNKQQIKTTVFNDQSLVQIGGRYNAAARRIDRPFVGVIAGAIYNGLKPLDLAVDKDPRTKSEGDVTALKSIPFDYKDQHPELFTKEAMRSMIDKVVINGQGNGIPPAGGLDGSKPVDPNHVVLSNIINCDDEEDCIAGSGSGDGPTNTQFVPTGPETNGQDRRVDVWYPEGTDSRYVPLPSLSPPHDDPDHDDTLDLDETTHDSRDWHKLMYPETSTHGGHSGDFSGNSHMPPTLLPLPLPPTGGGGGGMVDDPTNYVNYDEKWNVDEPVTEEPDANNPKLTKSMPGTMVLVIGIILGAFVAMILIVIIVLKMRTRVPGAIKVEEPLRGPQGMQPTHQGQMGMPGVPGGMAPRYQFSNAGMQGADYGDGPLGPPDPETATTSLMEGGPGSMAVGGNVPLLGGNGNHNNGFFPLAMNGDRSRFFRKPNGSKPVREWYV